MGSSSTSDPLPHHPSVMHRLRIVRWHKGRHTVSTDPRAIDAGAVQRYLAAENQSPAIPLAVVRRFIENSVNFGLFDGPGDAAPMVGYARVVSDFAAFAYVGDVFLLDGHRGQGMGSWLMTCAFGHPDLQGLRRWLLTCGPRPVGWYRRFGFDEPRRPGYALHRTNTRIYLDSERGVGEAWWWA